MSDQNLSPDFLICAHCQNRVVYWNTIDGRAWLAKEGVVFFSAPQPGPPEEWEEGEDE